MKILTVVGARPQFIKAATVSRTIRSTKNHEEVMVHTGQHFDAEMSDVFFSELRIPQPKYSLDIHGGGHGRMTGRMLEAIEEVIDVELDLGGCARRDEAACAGCTRRGRSTVV